MDPYRTNSVSEEQPAPSFDKIAKMPPAPVKKKINVGKYVLTYHYLDVNDKKQTFIEEHEGGKGLNFSNIEYEVPNYASNPLMYLRSDAPIRVYTANGDIKTFIPAHRILQVDAKLEEHFIELNVKP